MFQTGLTVVSTIMGGGIVSIPYAYAVAGVPILRAAPLCHLAPDMPRLLRSVQHRLQAEANRGRLADASHEDPSSATAR